MHADKFGHVRKEELEMNAFLAEDRPAACARQLDARFKRSFEHFLWRAAETELNDPAEILFHDSSTLL
jgi:hypothetical protein